MKTRILFSILLLGVSISATSITFKDNCNPYFPQHIYGGAKLDSVVTFSSNSTAKVIVLFDNKGRMILYNWYNLDEETNQWKAEAEEGYGYADGMMYTSMYRRYLDLELQQVQWEGGESRYKYGNIAYNEKGDPLRYDMYYWIENTNTLTWSSSYEFQYDEARRLVLGRITLWDPKKQAITTSEYTIEYVLDENGRVISQIDDTYVSPRKTEYIYNDQGDVQIEKVSNGYVSEIYDDQTGEYLRDTTEWMLWITRQYSYIYNAYNNIEKEIEYESNAVGQNRETEYYYYYSFPSTTEVENAEVTATPSENYSVILQWAKVEGADTYELDIKKDGELVCTLIFNEQGQLTGISFAPTRNGNTRDMPTAIQTTKGWQYKIEGLEVDTKYSYTATAKKDDLVLSTATVYFTTSLQAIEDIHIESDKPVKVQLNGQVFILRGDKTYTLQGQEVR